MSFSADETVASASAVAVPHSGAKRLHHEAFSSISDDATPTATAAAAAAYGNQQRTAASAAVTAEAQRRRRSLPSRRRSAPTINGHSLSPICTRRPIPSLQKRATQTSGASSSASPRAPSTVRSGTPPSLR